MAGSFLFLYSIPFLLIGHILCLQRRDFYPFGAGLDEALSQADDASSVEIQLRVPIIFFGEEYRSLYVNVNGLISFLTDVPNFHNIQFPFTFPGIAPFYADIDTRGMGNIYYRETDNPEILDRASYEVHTYFTGMKYFVARIVFIATWLNVGHYNAARDKVNSFQVIIATDGELSFVFLHYMDDGIQWISSSGKNHNQPDAPAQIGFMSGGSEYFIVQGSGTQHVMNMDNYSNVNNRGVYMFLVGNLGVEGNVKPADNVRREEVQTLDISTSETCTTNARLCDSNARCVDFHPGSCCECVSPYYGNGKGCIEIGKPQRVNGRVTGSLNGVQIENVDLHSYIVTSEGRTYTAVSQIPIRIGFSMQTLNVIGGILGWLFAVPTPRAQNGFMLTGGIFNHTAVIRFLSPESTVIVKQYFSGQDLFQYLHMTGEISGTAPEIPRGAKINLEDYSEEYRRVSPGVVKSFATHTYYVDGISHRFTIDQTFNFEECSYDSQFSESNALKLNVVRNFIIYDENEKLVRYAMTNKMGLLTSVNPCSEASAICRPYSHCVADGDSYRCVCDLGYEAWYQEGPDEQIACIDVNECLGVTNVCIEDADCFNTPGSYRCQCKPGFTGDGQSCRRQQTCDILECHPHAVCIINPRTTEPECKCLEGYYGDGFTCQTQGRDNCDEENICDPNAQCIFDPNVERFRCECDTGYRGNGYHCVQDGVVQCNTLGDCHPQAQCIYDNNYHTYRCQCNSGFEGDGRTCRQKTDVSCDVDNICSVNADCVYNAEAMRHKCQCRSGYRGDGINCFTSVTDECNVINTCHISAECLLDETTQRYYCRCKRGYRGDGRTYCDLEESNCDIVNNCHPDADCAFDVALLEHQCRCKSGFVGDGSFCRRQDSCLENPHLCHDNAVCNRESSSELYKCQCKSGFDGDGLNCRAVSQESGQVILFNQGMAIMEMPLTANENNPGRQIFMIPGQLAIGIEVDCYEKFFYWSDVSQRTINKAKLDGTNDEILISSELGSPEGLSVDWVSRNIYWTDSALDQIEVASLNGLYRKVLIKEELVNPRGIAVHPQKGKLFWADWNRQAPKIESSNLDGSERAIFLAENINLPNALTIDYENEDICWADAGTHKLECVNFDAQNRRTIYSGISYPFGLTNFRDRFYWTDWDVNAILSIHKSGSVSHTEHQIPLGGGGRLYGIVAVKDYCPRLSNACLGNNGGCPFLCLPKPFGGRTCACPDKLNEGESCEESK